MKHTKFKREHTKHLPETLSLDSDYCYSCGPHSRWCWSLLILRKPCVESKYIIYFVSAVISYSSCWDCASYRTKIYVVLSTKIVRTTTINRKRNKNAICDNVIVNIIIYTLQRITWRPRLEAQVPQTKPLQRGSKPLNKDLDRKASIIYLQIASFFSTMQ